MFVIRPILRQYTVVIAVNLMVLCVGMDSSWSSPALVKLRDPAESPFSPVITEDEGGWIVSIGFLFCIFMLPCISLFVDFIGRKYCLITVCVPKVIAGLITIFASEVWMLLVARAINTSTNTAVLMIIIIYSTEIASKEVRGGLGSVPTILFSFGGLIMLGIGPYISYLNINILVTAVTVCACIPLFFIPDTPYSLFNKGKIKQAKKVLIYFRGSDMEAEEEIKGFDKKETNRKIDIKEILKTKVYQKAFFLTIVMGIGVQVIGFNCIWFYLQTILEMTNTSISPALGSLLLGVIQVLAGIFASIVSDRFGRKTIIISTLLGIAVGMIGLGIFFTCKKHGVVCDLLNYLPLISLTLITWCHNGGVGSQFLVIVTELLDDRTRAIGTSASLIAAAVAVFLLSRYTLAILSALGTVATFIMFGVICIMMSLFVLFFIPETKQRTIADIQRALGGLKENGESKDCVSKL